MVGELGSQLVEKAKGAFLGAAIGDALGWPHEYRSQRIRSRGLEGEKIGFQTWVRYSGGRYYAHEETVLAGEYSDDTQLLLCTARSLLHGGAWLHHLINKELAAWTLYERGAGVATKRSCEAWLTGKPPWFTVDSVSQGHWYYEAGGNGAAMRIMPHCLVHAGQPSFGPLARDILANAVCTHGHPRALIGALVYGYALWNLFKESGTLPYGAVIERVLASADAWSELPGLPEVLSSWHDWAFKATRERYQEVWNATVGEMRDLLEKCRNAMRHGALAIDEQVLSELGCLEPKTNGAGTVNAAAAIFLASRYAADPLHGIYAAAFAEGADTDTLACMTGCLLGALGGSNWMGDYATAVQDGEYLTKTAQGLASMATEWFHGIESPQLIAKSLEMRTFIKNLESSSPGDLMDFPDDRKATVMNVMRYPTRSRGASALVWKLETLDGQTLYVKRISRKQPVAQHEGKAAPTSLVQPDMRGRLTIRLPVSDLKESRDFYSRLGLQVTKESPHFVDFGDLILVRKQGFEAPFSGRRPWVSLVVEVAHVQTVLERVARAGARITVQALGTGAKRPFFKCEDPDGNEIEIVETSRPSP